MSVPPAPDTAVLDVFVSYVPADARVALALTEALSAYQLGLDIEPDRFADATGGLPAYCEQAIARAHATILILSPESVNARGVREEALRAAGEGHPILGLLANGAEAPPWWIELDGDTRLMTLDAPIPGLAPSIARAVRRAHTGAAPVISVMNLKGGVGKTTVSAQLAAAIRVRQGARVLMLDLDPQQNLSQLFLRNAEQETLVREDRSVMSLFERSQLTGDKSPREDWKTIEPRPIMDPPIESMAFPLTPSSGEAGRVDLICGQFDLAKYNFAVSQTALGGAHANWERSLAHARRLYDVVLIDTNPSASFLTRAALTASDLLIAPVFMNRFSLRGVELLSGLSERLVHPEPTPEIAILRNRVERRGDQPGDFEEALVRGDMDNERFAFSRALFQARLARSRSFEVKEEGNVGDRMAHMAVHRARGIWGAQDKDAVLGLADEALAKLDAKSAVARTPPAA